jgi:hypothetical protein
MKATAIRSTNGENYSNLCFQQQQQQLVCQPKNKRKTPAPPFSMI